MRPSEYKASERDDPQAAELTNELSDLPTGDTGCCPTSSTQDYLPSSIRSCPTSSSQTRQSMTSSVTQASENDEFQVHELSTKLLDTCAEASESDQRPLHRDTIELQKRLEDEKQNASKTEDYLEAHERKRQLERLQAAVPALRDLAARARQVCQNEDYQAASALQMLIHEIHTAAMEADNEEAAREAAEEALRRAPR